MKDAIEGTVRFDVPAALADAVEENLFEWFGGIPLSAARGPAGELSIWVRRTDAVAAKAVLGIHGLGDVTPFEEIPRDFEAEAAALRKSVTVGRYLLDPHDGALGTRPSAGQIRLSLPAARAFGTGSHASTRLGIRLLLGERLRGRRVLDAGCGAGTLAFIAALEGAALVVAFDIDPDAALAAREHGRANRIPRVAVFAGPLGALRPGERFDVIVANLIHEEVAPLLSGLRTRLSPGGRLLCSGLLVEREREWADHLGEHRFRVVRALTESEWLGTAAETFE
jgi:ribosomal protein L11 methylase PrmA